MKSPPSPYRLLPLFLALTASLPAAEPAASSPPAPVASAPAEPSEADLLSRLTMYYDPDSLQARQWREMVKGREERKRERKKLNQ